MSWFGNKLKFNPFQAKKRKVPDGLFTKCEKCNETIYNKDVGEAVQTCPKCQHHFTMSAWDRIETLLDSDTFTEHDKDLTSADPLEFQGPKSYPQKLDESQKITGLKEAAVSGMGAIQGHLVSFCVTDSRFIMGSMGSVVGEKISRCLERSLEQRIPAVIVSGSGGGARMYEGCFSLMQMAKTSGMVARLNEAGIPFISVLTNPTMGGVLASFASQGDFILAEPGALIGFAGPRVIADIVKQELPEGFQKAEYLLEHGMVDRVVHRRELKKEIAQILDLLQGGTWKQRQPLKKASQ